MTYHLPAPVMAYDARRHEYTLADGTTVPAEVLHREGIRPTLPDLTHPALAAHLIHLRDQASAATWAELPTIYTQGGGYWDTHPPRRDEDHA